ncbi:MAG: site-specific integrase [Deltaproteobacteria bacterium]|nr:site-specific integrase [Deltaproteobacteria bacterium]
MYQRDGNWITEFYHNGIRYKKSLGMGISKTVAKEREAKYRQEVREGKHHVKARRIRFETFAEKYLEHARVNKKPKSAKRNEVSIGQLMPYFKGKLIGSIHPFQVEQYKKIRRDGGAAPATVNRDVACLRNMLNKAVDWSYLQVNPISKVKLLHEDNEVMWVLSPGEEARLLEECEKIRQPEKYLRDLVEFALYSGMREAEIFGLRRVNVHLEENYLLATDTKTHQDRPVPINETMREILQRRMERPGSDFVFCNHNGERLTHLSRGFKGARKKAGLIRWDVKDGETVEVRFRFHDLRHTFGSRLGMNGTDLKSIMEIMGHKTAKVAMRYQHPSPSHKLEAVKGLDKIRGIVPQKIVRLNKIRN